VAPSRHADRERECPLLREARTPSVMSSAAWQRQPEWKILDENEIVDGVDELGVLLYGHAKNRAKNVRSRGKTGMARESRSVAFLTQSRPCVGVLVKRLLNPTPTKRCPIQRNPGKFPCCAIQEISA